MVLPAGQCLFSYKSLASLLQNVWKDIEILVFSLKFLGCGSMEENPFIPLAAIVTGE